MSNRRIGIDPFAFMILYKINGYGTLTEYILFFFVSILDGWGME